MTPTRPKLSLLVALGLSALLVIGPAQSGFAADEEIVLPAPQPTVSAMFPAGLTRGTSIVVKVRGANLTQASAVRVHGKGISAEIVPLAEGQKPNSREISVMLTAAADAAPGLHELRVVTPSGTSNVVRFGTSALPEVIEIEPNETASLAQRLDQLPIVVNGVVSRREDRDCFRFSAKAGQQIVLDLCGQSLHPYISRLRPGWLEGILTVREATEIGIAADANFLVVQTATEKAAVYKAANAAIKPVQAVAKKAAAAKVAADKVVATKTKSAKTAAERFAAASAAAEKAAAGKTAAEKIAAEKAIAAKTASDKAIAAKAVADKAIATKTATDSDAAVKIASNKANAAKLAADKANADKANAAKAAAAKAGLAKTATNKVAAGKAAVAKTAAEKVAADKAAAGKAAAATAANEKVAAARANAKKAAEELAAANTLVVAKKAAVKKLADLAYRNLAYSSGLGGREDPALVFTVPKDGQYVVEVRDDLYRGRADFNYRLTIGELPFVTSAFPAGGKRGTTTLVSLQGANLGDANKLSVAIAADGLLDKLWLERTSTPLGLSNDIALELGDDPETIEAEPNDTSDKATAVQVPAVLNGVIQREGDIDYFKFTATKGQRLIFQTVSQSLGSPLDARLDLYDANGRRLKNNDDSNSSFESYIDYTIRADGEYVIRIADTTGLGSHRHVYRLKVHQSRPDFSLVVSPDNPRVDAGGTIALTVMAKRLEGFTGEIEITIPNLPPGASVSPTIIATNQSQAVMALTMSADAANSVVPISVVGKAKINDQDVTRQAVPGERVRYVNAWRYVPVDDLVLTVMPKAPLTLAWAKPEITITSGTTIELPVKVQRAKGFTSSIRIVLVGLPSRVAAPPVTIAENETEVIVEIRSYNGAPVNLANVVATGTVRFKGRSFIQNSPALRLQVEAPPAKKKK